MHTVTIYIFDFCMFGGMIACVFYLRELRPVLAHLRDKHPQLWNDLGMPEITPGTAKWKIDKMLASAFSKPVAFFLLLRKYEMAGDTDLAALCKKARKPLLFGVACGTGLLVVVLPQLLYWFFTHGIKVF